MGAATCFKCGFPVHSDVMMGMGLGIAQADNESIRVGRNSNIQDGTVIHCDEGCAVVVEDNVTVGHACILHGCTIGKGTTVGMGSIIMNDTVIGENCIIGRSPPS